MRAPVLPAVIFVLIIIILLAKIIMPVVIICGIVALIIYIIRTVVREYQEKLDEKRHVQDKINTLKRVIEDNEIQYHSILGRVAKLGDERIFLLSYAEKLFIRIELDKAKLALLDDTQNIENLSHSQLQVRISVLQDDLSKYRKVDTYKMNSQQAEYYKELIEILREINKSTFYVGENQYRFTNTVYNSVFLDNADVYALITKTGSIYFYPQYIVLANSKTDFTIIRWKNISVSTKTENRYSRVYLTNGEIIRTSYCYTCKDGSPDQRYKHNPINYTYRYGIVKIRNFELAIPNSMLAIRLNDIILNIKSIHNG
jgi:hypothetical protein